VNPTSFDVCPALTIRTLARRQHGTALVLSLVILVILTILGVTALSTSSLEEKMAGSMQEVTKAFEAAESGIESALATPGVMNLNAATTNSFAYASGQSGTADVTTTLIEFSPPKRGSGYSSQYRAANFSLSSKGTTTSNARVTIDQGVGQIMPRQ